MKDPNGRIYWKRKTQDHTAEAWDTLVYSIAAIKHAELKFPQLREINSDMRFPTGRTDHEGVCNSLMKKIHDHRSFEKAMGRPQISVVPPGVESAILLPREAVQAEPWKPRISRSKWMSAHA